MPSPPPQKTPPPKSPPIDSRRSTKTFEIKSGKIKTAQRIGIYGTGGIGKSSLAASMPDPVFVDIASGTNELDVRRLHPETWDDIIGMLHDENLWKNCQTVVIDTMTDAEEFAIKHTVANVKTDRGEEVQSIEGYGYGKGLVFVYDTFLPLFAALDRHVAAGRHVVLICHDCATKAPNRNGDDWLRFEPRLQSPASGKNSIRHKMKEWLDHLFFIDYDVAEKDGKGKGIGTRCIYPTERPTYIAKSRKLSESITYGKDSPELWNQLFA